MCAFPTPPPLRPKPPRPPMPEQLKGANPRPVRLVMATTIAVCVLLYALVGALLARLFLWSVFVRTWSPYGMLGIVLIPFAVFGVWGGIYFGTRIIMAALKVDGHRL